MAYLCGILLRGLLSAFVVGWVLSSLFCTDAAITWTKPFPQYTPLDRAPENIRTTNIRLLNGSAGQRLIWDYSLSGETLDKVFWEIRRKEDAGGTRIGIKKPSGSVSISNTENFLEHFNISSSDPATLIIYDVTEADEALFSCKVENSNGDVWTDIIQVKIVVESQLINVSNSQAVCEGEDVTLFCEAKGKPDPTVNWTRVLENGSDSEVLDTGEQLVLSNIDRSGSATYRCAAYNGVGKSVNETMDLLVQIPPTISSLKNQTIREGNIVTLYCNVSGSPEPNVTWTNVSSGVTRDGKTWNITNISRTDAGEYRCDASNECGNDTRSTFITVTYPPEILVISPNQTVNESNTLTLNCTAGGKPLPVITWTKVSNNNTVAFPLTITGKQDEGSYRCSADNGVGSPASKDVFVTVANYHPINTDLKTSLQNNIVKRNEAFNITCSAEASPTSKYQFFREQESVFNDTSGVGMFTTNVTERLPNVMYRCIPYNSFGEGPVKDITVTVHYPPQITMPREETLEFDKDTEVEIVCNASGNPLPTITWSNETSNTIAGSDGRLRFNSINEKDSGSNYTCVADNGIQPADSFTVVLIVGVKKENVTMKFPDEVYDPAYENVKSDEFMNFSRRLQEGLREVRIINDTLESIQVIELRNGSVVADVFLEFNRIVPITSVISELKAAAKIGRLGDLTVDPESITLKRTTDSPTTPNTPTTLTTPATTTPTTTTSDDVPWLYIGIGVGGLVLVVVIIVIVACCVHKKRKCRKETRVSDSENRTDEQSLQELRNGTRSGDNPYASVNQAYAASGPSPTDANPQPAAGTSSVPEYSVEDKSKKKGRNVNVNQKPPEYAVVDKSKKNKKGKQAEKKRPGEVVYADLGSFHSSNPMAVVATSPKPLPPIKQPTPYVGTEYAEITQFLKGNATLPDQEHPTVAGQSPAKEDGAHSAQALPRASTEPGKKEGMEHRTSKL